MVQINREGGRSSLNHAEVWGSTGSTKVYIRYRDGKLLIREASNWSDGADFISGRDAETEQTFTFDLERFSEVRNEVDDWNKLLEKTEYELDNPKF